MPPRKRAKKKRAAARKRAPRKPARRAPAPKQRRATARAARPSAAGRRLGEVAETVDVLMPELAARLAALEHMLIEKKLCSRDDLLRARAFVDLRRGEV